MKKALAAGRVGIDGKELTRPETPSVNGFKLMNMTPTPALGVDDSPLMTWGQAESTPYMLGGCETPLVTRFVIIFVSVRSSSSHNVRPFVCLSGPKLSRAPNLHIRSLSALS